MARSTPDWMDTLFDSDGDNTAQAVKASGGSLKWMHVANPNVVEAYVQLFDLATANVTVGTTTPKLSLRIPSGNGGEAGMYETPWMDAVKFYTAITYACTTTAAGAGDPTTGLTLNFGFI